LKIQRDIRLQPAGLPHPRQQTPWRAEPAKFAARKNVDMIDVAISAQERRPFRVDDPGNFGVGMSIANRGNRWQSVNDIAERARFDNQDLQRHDWNTLILIFSPREKEPFSPS
jgi:hypothetical protein